MGAVILASLNTSSTKSLCSSAAGLVIVLCVSCDLNISPLISFYSAIYLVKNCFEFKLTVYMARVRASAKSGSTSYFDLI